MDIKKLAEISDETYEELEDFLYDYPFDVKFDFENICLTDQDIRLFQDDINKILGYHELPNGFSFYGLFAGGDWEIPVFFILFDHNGETKAYVPKQGNVFNTTTMSAYGNDSDSDDANIKACHGEDGADNFNQIYDTEAILKEVENEFS